MLSIERVEILLNNLGFKIDAIYTHHRKTYLGKYYTQLLTKDYNIIRVETYGSYIILTYSDSDSNSKCFEITTDYELYCGRLETYIFSNEIRDLKIQEIIN